MAGTRQYYAIAAQKNPGQIDDRSSNMVVVAIAKTCPAVIKIRNRTKTKGLLKDILQSLSKSVFRLMSSKITWLLQLDHSRIRQRQIRCVSGALVPVSHFLSRVLCARVLKPHIHDPTVILWLVLTGHRDDEQYYIVFAVVCGAVRYEHEINNRK